MDYVVLSDCYTIYCGGIKKKVYHFTNDTLLNEKYRRKLVIVSVVSPKVKRERMKVDVF